jgi:hypothetical protein
MSSLQPTTPEPLPFDILGAIFAHYASEETIHHPLETLLLVSRCWADAALGHQTLWSHLKIYFGHKLTSKVWDVRLPLRLARAGPTTPLYIDIRNYLDMPYCPQAQKDVQNDRLFSSLPCHRVDDVDDGYDDELCTCYQAARASVHKALKQIAGKSGELCARWRSLKLDLGHSEDGIKGTELVAIALSYPTPQLTTLVLRNVQFDDDILLSVFPSAPALNDITILDCTLPSLPQFDNIRQATIGWKVNIRHFHDFSVFRQATRVEKLHLHVPPTSTAAAAQMCFPDRLYDLQVLHISGNSFPQQLYNCQMPMLSSVTLEYQYENILAHFLACKGFVHQNLRRVILLRNIRARPTSEEIHSTLASLLGLLIRARNLESITVEKEMLNILLKLIWCFAKTGRPLGQGIEGPPVNGIWIINRTIGEGIYLRGDETCQRLEEIANGWDLVPLHCSMEEFISRLQVSSPFFQFIAIF